MVAQKTSQKQMAIAYALILLWMVVIFLFSNQPAAISDQQSGFFVDIFESVATNVDSSLLTFLTRKAAHFFSYFVLGILTYNAILLHGFRLQKTVLICVAIVLSYASFDETHQLFVAGRSGEVRDVLIDTTAGMVGIGAYALIQQVWTRKKSQNMLKYSNEKSKKAL